MNVKTVNRIVSHVSSCSPSLARKWPRCRSSLLVLIRVCIFDSRALRCRGLSECSLSACLLLLFVLRRMVFALDIGEIYGGLRKRHAEFFHRVGGNLRNSQITKPFVVGWNYIPGRFARAGFCDGILKRLDIIIP